jgi:hypothetical protein
MLREFGRVYTGAWRYMLACPLLFAVPVAAEFIQHVVEMRIGMYGSWEAAQAVEADGARMAWGVVKTLSLTLAGFWLARFLLLPGGAEAARRWDPRAAGLYFWVMLFSLATTALTLWGGDMLRAAGLGAAATPATGIFMALTIVLGVMLAPWKVGAALGNPAMGFLRSFRLVGWRAWWGVIFLLLTVLPLMIVHYAFLPATILAGGAWKWVLLAIDALVVGGLAAVIGAVDVTIARRAAEAAGADLAPVPA